MSSAILSLLRVRKELLMHFELKKDLTTICVIFLSSMLMAINLNTFVETGALYPGGVTGLTVLLQRISETYLGLRIPYTPVNLLLNAIPIYIGFRFIGKKFTLYSCLSIVLTSVLTDLIPSYVITYDTLLISIFGGIINGLAISLCLLMDATTGGTDFIAIYISQRKGIDSWNIILFYNIVVLAIAGAIFGWDKSLYSIIFQYASTQTIHVLYKKYQRKTLFIVTDKADKVCSTIYATSQHGATILKGEGALGHSERQIVYSVVSSDESKKVIHAVKKVDPNSFVNAIRTEELAGRFYQKHIE